MVSIRRRRNQDETYSFIVHRHDDTEPPKKRSCEQVRHIPSALALAQAKIRGMLPAFRIGFMSCRRFLAESDSDVAMICCAALTMFVVDLQGLCGYGEGIERIAHQCEWSWSIKVPFLSLSLSRSLPRTIQRNDTQGIKHALCHHLSIHMNSPIVLHQVDCLRLGEHTMKVSHTLDIGTSPAVDRLVGISHHQQRIVR